MFDKIDVIPLQCPNPKCRKIWNVPLARLDRQLVCKKCRTEFYVNQTGGSVIQGKRPKVFVDPHKLGSGRTRRPDVIEKAFRWWDWLSPDKKRLAKLVALSPLLVVLFLNYLMPMLRPGPKLPGALAARATMLIQALSRHDMEKLTALTSPESRGDLAKWTELARPDEWPETMPILPIKSVDILFQESKQKRAGVQVVVESGDAPPPAPPPEPEAEEGTAEDQAAKEAMAAYPGEAVAEDPAAMPASPAPSPTEAGEAMPAEGEAQPEVKTPPKPPFRFRLYWSPDGSGGWLFNATESLKAIPKGPT